MVEIFLKLILSLIIFGLIRIIEADYVVLAKYMRLLRAEFVAKYYQND